MSSTSKNGSEIGELSAGVAFFAVVPDQVHSHFLHSEICIWTDSELITGKRMDTQSRYLRLRKEDIAYFKFIIESYEGMAVVRTRDRSEAVVELMIAPGWEKDVDELLEGLQNEIPIEYL